MPHYVPWGFRGWGGNGFVAGNERVIAGRLSGDGRLREILVVAAVLYLLSMLTRGTPAGIPETRPAGAPG